MLAPSPQKVPCPRDARDAQNAKKPSTTLRPWAIAIVVAALDFLAGPSRTICALGPRLRGPAKKSALHSRRSRRPARKKTFHDAVTLGCCNRGCDIGILRETLTQQFVRFRPRRINYLALAALATVSTQKIFHDPATLGCCNCGCRVGILRETLTPQFVRFRPRRINCLALAAFARAMGQKITLFGNPGLLLAWCNWRRGLVLVELQ